MLDCSFTNEGLVKNDYSLDLMIKVYEQRLTVLEDDYLNTQDILLEKERKVNNLRKLVLILKRGDKVCQQ